MAQTFFFYDLETSGIDTRECRIMQFAGQRTDMELNPVGEPFNVLVKMTPDVLPDPDAIMVTGITPQDTLRDGITEAEFVDLFLNEVAVPDTILLGFNTVRYDDECMRCMLYRNFADPYEWHWKEGRSRWDLLDLARMTRALRPDGIEWPFTDEGKPTVRLEYLTKANKLGHDKAHDALSDVHASIAVAKLIRDKQPDLFTYLLSMRDKKKVAELVEGGQPFVYTSGKYSDEYSKTTVVMTLAKHPSRPASIVYNLRDDPTQYLQLSPEELVKRWQWVKDRPADQPRLPAKTLQYNRCPAVAPLGVLNDETRKRLQVDLEVIKKHRALIAAAPDFRANIVAAIKLMDDYQAKEQAKKATRVDGQIYNGFLDNYDARLLPEVRAAAPEQLSSFSEKFHDNRMKDLLPLYKARNYPEHLSAEERSLWDAHCTEKIFAGGPKSQFAHFAQRLQALAATDITDSQRFALEELQLYAESIMPTEYGQ